MVTVTEHCAIKSLKETVIIAVPILFAVTIPLSFTDTIESSSLSHEKKDESSLSESESVACNSKVSPFFRVSDVESKEMVGRAGSSSVIETDSFSS